MRPLGTLGYKKGWEDEEDGMLGRKLCVREELSSLPTRNKVTSITGVKSTEMAMQSSISRALVFFLFSFSRQGREWRCSPVHETR